MVDPKGFLKYTHRELPNRRPVAERVHDWNEVYKEFQEDALRKQATRCMDCGIPFCHNGCPLGNLIPEWNDLVRTGRWREAIDRLHATNNFPDFTGRLCPAPCEPACVLGINQPPVTIKQIEYEIIERAFKEGWVQPLKPTTLT
ncbi:MAG: glutamate synthase, partial [Mycobacterium sp.]